MTEEGYQEVRQQLEQLKAEHPNPEVGSKIACEIARLEGNLWAFENARGKPDAA